MFKFNEDLTQLGQGLKSEAELRMAIKTSAKEIQKYLNRIDELEGKPDVAFVNPLGTVTVLYNKIANDPQILFQFQNTFGETYDLALIKFDFQNKYLIVKLWEQGPDKDNENFIDDYRWNTEALKVENVDNKDYVNIFKDELTSMYDSLESLSEVELREVRVKQTQLELAITKKMHRMVSSSLFVETPLGTLSAIYEPNDMPDPYINVMFKSHGGDYENVIDIEYDTKENSIKVHSKDILQDEWSTYRFDKNPLIDAFSIVHN
ncbi:hypothetical protein [Bacillus cereus]|uniref:hypothetical protein n=1 Tax=Bacillus cereus TaxID=1396 RepID=UPI000B4AD49B|nr:hypothetical protein [Bacillus cereus]